MQLKTLREYWPQFLKEAPTATCPKCDTTYSRKFDRLYIMKNGVCLDCEPENRTAEVNDILDLVS